ncbi:hypothetical protein, partial [Escherichia coli]|uniref:hypothetical protein n=1 Tax=Escherichia coli TaxID=562 RepID=UPI001124F485
MKLADIQLRHYHYNFIRLESSAEGMDSDNEQKGLIYPELDASKVRTSITVGEPETPKDSVEQFFIITLCVEYNQPDFPYSFSVEVEGIFDWKLSVDSNTNTSEEDGRKHLYVVNGVSILYS